ncbi:MAG: tRNA uridine-5-carboxymethylaminomethyl(34) synthesis GTPase MnmE [Lachnospiraceae bacterium]|nr:tRNA uridine-5-carboxymethylaminomethyl(34) synthesis GTPase MnmE [Lachnospiraceae bacterium]
MQNGAIAAISTGMTNSGIGIVRMSGDGVFEIIDKVYSGKERLSQASSHTIHYGFIKDGDETIDEVLVMLMRGPKSFTGEDTVEINCHGGTYVVKRVLETVIKYGALPAEPGEFTKRAFLNGRIDMSQAEAVIDVINSKNEYAMKSSVSQLKGSIQKKISEIRNQIIYHTAFIETALDDPEHISVDGYGEKLKKTIDLLLQNLKELIDSSDNGRIMKEGIQTVIVGKPNAGKSSLLNVLVGRDRAIVTDIAGTTRDILEEQISLHGLSLNVIDTAGIRDTEDIIEKMGVEKAKDYANEADLIIYVVDASRELDENDDKILRLLGQILSKKEAGGKQRGIILLNKSDLSTVITQEILQKRLENLEIEGILLGETLPVIEISAKEEQGIRNLENALKSMFLNGNISFNDEVFITNIRQKKALQDAYKSLQKVNESIENQMPEDFYSIDLLDAYESLGNITGETIGEDLVNEIFSKFCMGK